MLIGQILIWSVAVELLACVPLGLAISGRAILARQFSFTGAADRVSQFIAGLALAGAAASLIHQFGPSFLSVAFG